MARPALKPIASDDDAFDTTEVPAAVVCARCGRPDCPGCESPEETTHPSGVIAIIPWERPIGSTWSRLWSTSLAVSLRTDSFFGPLSAGEVAPSLRYSIACETIAVASVALSLAAAVFAIIPGITIDAMTDPRIRNIVLRLFALGIPGFAALLVVMHLVWGWALDKGACRVGARSHRSQALRFGLYSTGLDLMTSPVGLLYALLAEGGRTAAKLLPAAVEVPRIATNALLRRVYHLADLPAARARKFSTITVSVLAPVLVLGTMIALVASLFL
ncbi:MAG TPA: hypothetical protein PLI95_07655 [Polyangiaceae bacterium]|nr:hypothetical protein [Polyangiaceae bacterium]